MRAPVQLHHPRAVIFHRAEADAEARRDFLVGKPGDREVEHLALPVGQAFEARAQFDKILGRDLTPPRRVPGVADGSQQPAFVERLFDEIESAELDGCDRHIDIAVAGDQDDRRGPAAFGKARHEVEPAEPRHAHIGHHAIELHRIRGGADEGVPARKAVNRERIALEVEPQRIKNRRIVVDQRNVHFLIHRHDRPSPWQPAE